MTKQFTRRLLAVTACCCCLFVLFGSRSASAAVPMCDERGASAIAPSPILPIRDVKLESSAPLGCEVPLTAFARGAPAARDDAPPIPDPGVRDAWLNERAPSAPTVAPSRAHGAQRTPLPARRPGHGLSVFRPPRN